MKTKANREETILKSFERYYKKVYKLVYGIDCNSETRRVEFKLFKVFSKEENMFHIETFWYDGDHLQNKNGAVFEYWKIVLDKDTEDFDIFFIPSKETDYQFSYMNSKYYCCYLKHFLSNTFFNNAIILNVENISEYFDLIKFLEPDGMNHGIVHTGVLYQETELGKQFIAEMEKF